MARKNFIAFGTLAIALAGGVYVSNGHQPAEPAAARGVQTVSAASKPEPKAPKPTVSYAAYEDAARQNARLARDIKWTFGGRTQNGWALHGALVATMVGTEADYHSPEFAAAVAEWQKKNDVSPADGVVTRDCWLKMMKELQAARTFDSTPCPTDELVQIEAARWWDTSRPAELRHLRRDAYEAYERMVAAARAELGSEADGYFQIVSGHRSPEYQAALRARAGNPSTASLAKRSPHFTGRAIDIFVGGSPVSTADANRAIQVETPAFKWLAKNAHKFGFRPYFYEPWHWEYDPRLAAEQR